MGATADDFASWFASQQGIIDPAVGFSYFEGEGGRGAVALADIPEGRILFTLPRDLTLSTRTSSLPRLFGVSEWKTAALDKGWSGLILCLCWEHAQGSQSKWSGYLACLPTSFTTPMFWNEEDLAELQGTAVIDKIGRDDAEQDYYSKFLPAVQSRPDLFLPEDIEHHYSLRQYHIMGSCILSRSFHVEKWQGTTTEDEEIRQKDIAEPEGTRMEGSMDVDEPEDEHEIEVTDDSDDEDNIEDPADVAMVPMADMLNARYGCENAKLFYEEHVLQMISTKPIKKGEQIWNTYGDPPNSDLLRRYGHVDLIKSKGQNTFNPADLVEIAANLVVSVVTSDSSASGTETKIEWWLEQGGEDVFVVDTDLTLPDDLLSFIRLLGLPSAEWEQVQSKSKPPKPRRDPGILETIGRVLRARLKEYTTTAEFDEQLLQGDLSLNKKNAVIVRLGEKRILSRAIEHVESELRSLSTKKRRKSNTEREEKKKRSKR